MKRRLLILMVGLMVATKEQPPAQANPAIAARAAIAACTLQPEICTIAGVAGVGTWIMWKNAPKLWCTAGWCSPTQHPRERRMLTDPDASEETTEQYVWADDEHQARSLCEKTAERRGWRLDRVVLANKMKNNAGKRRFTCTWTMFGDPRY